jgi:hypothetical protein
VWKRTSSALHPLNLVYRKDRYIEDTPITFVFIYPSSQLLPPPSAAALTHTTRLQGKHPFLPQFFSNYYSHAQSTYHLTATFLHYRVHLPTTTPAFIDREHPSELSLQGIPFIDNILVVDLASLLTCSRPKVKRNQDERVSLCRFGSLSTTGVHAVGNPSYPHTNLRRIEYELKIRQEPSRAKVCTSKEKGILSCTVVDQNDDLLIHRQ